MTKDEVEKFVKCNIDKVAQIEIGQCHNCGEYVMAIIPGKNAYIDTYGVEMKGNRLVCAKCGGKLKHIETRRQKEVEIVIPDFLMKKKGGVR